MSTPTPTVAIEALELVKTYPGDVHAVRGISFDVAAGEVFERLWASEETPRTTFSSQHESALPLYARFGLTAHWPLLHLSGDAERLTPGEAVARQCLRPRRRLWSSA